MASADVPLARESRHASAGLGRWLWPLFTAAVFVTANMALWSTPLTHVQLCAVAVPLALAYFSIVFRVYGWR